MIDPYEIDRQIRSEYRRSRLLLSERLLTAAGVMLAVLVSVQKGRISGRSFEHVLMTATWIFLLSSMIAGIGVLILDLMSQRDTLDHFQSECLRIVGLGQDARPEPYVYGKKHSIALILQLYIFLAASVCLTCYGILGL
jgi:hypothetical protein